MIVGEYTQDNQAVVDLLVRSQDGQEMQVTAVIDTGFSGFLMLPRRIVGALNLPLLHEREILLGDGSITRLPVHEATVLWDEEERVVPAYSSDGDPLIGMKLLREHLVTLELVQGGAITIEAAV